MIVKLQSAVKDYIWGGAKLKSDFNKVSDGNIAESWELSFNPDGLSAIASGEHAGQALADVATLQDIGKNAAQFPFFPVLNKLIDAKSNLSVQVHPDDFYALKNEGQFGKTEMWHILDAEQGAQIYLGLNCSLTADEFFQAIQNKSILSYLNVVSVRAGETYFIPSGTLHAIGAGVTLYEIQQNSTLTYRVYDYDRKDKFGNTRQLHIDKAKQVANLNKYDVPSPKRECLLGSCKYFSAYRYIGDNEFCFGNSFCAVTVVDGSVAIADILLNKGETAFVSAGERFKTRGSGTYILTCVEK